MSYDNVPDGFDWSEDMPDPHCPRCLAMGYKHNVMRWNDLDEEFVCCSCWLTLVGMSPDQITELTPADLVDMGLWDPEDMPDLEEDND